MKNGIEKIIVIPNFQRKIDKIFEDEWNKPEGKRH